MGTKDNDRERAFVYLREMTNEKGKKARIAIAGAFGEMLNRVFDNLEELERLVATPQYPVEALGVFSSVSDWSKLAEGE